MALGSQLSLLLWKILKYRIRNKIQLIIELVWPLFLFLVLIFIRDSQPPFHQQQCHLHNKALPSAGTLTWIQGIICNFNNPCFQQLTPGEIPGQMGNFDNSTISRFLVDARNLLGLMGNETTLSALTNFSQVINNLENRPELWPNLPIEEYLKDKETFSSFIQTSCNMSSASVDQLLRAKLNLYAILLGRTGISLSDIVCNATVLGRYLTVDADTSFTKLQQELCAVPPDLLQKAGKILLSQMDFKKIFMKQQLQFSSFELLELSQTATLLSEQLVSFVNEVPTQSSFSDLNTELKLLQLENRTALTNESLQAFSRIMCGTSVRGGKVPYFHWTHSKDLRMLLGTQTFINPDLEDKDNNTTPFCRGLIEKLQSNPISRILWKNIKPIITGKLLYTPDTPNTQRIMKEVNRTFEDMEILQEVKDAWEEVGPKVKNFMENSLDIHILQDLLKRPEVALMVNQRLQNTSWDAAHIAHFISTPDPKTARTKGEPPTWLDIHQNINMTISIVTQITKCFKLNKLEGMATEEDMVVRALDLIKEHQFWAGIVFLLPDPSHTKLPPHIKYKIRMNIEDVKRTDKILDLPWDPDPATNPIRDMQYITGGFVYVQDLVERAITCVLSGKQPTTGLYLQQMPHPCFMIDFFLQELNRIFPLFMTLAWTYSVALIIKSMVYEKEARLKETMRIMGLSSGTLWLSWFFSSLVPFLFSCTILSVILKFGDILYHSDPSVVLIFLVAYSTALIMLCFLVSTFFSRANLAAVCGNLICFFLYLPYVLCINWREYLTHSHKIIASFLPPVAFGFGCEYISHSEEQGVGIQWNNMRSSPIEGDKYNLATSIAMLYFDAFIFAVAAWYIEAVFPGQYGIPKPWYFVFQLNYWGGAPLEAGYPIPPTPRDEPNDCIEPEPAHLTLGVAIHNLVKVYQKGATLAVNHLNLKFYEGQITALLGPNGAGKTSTLSIMTGLFPPTSGTVYIKGMDIRTHMNVIRRNLGVCPQHNVLFDLLTVEEHVWFYGRMKGMSSAEVKDEVDSLLEDVGLLDKRHEQAKTLSGGMKRKLSVAIAFIGGSKVVILDEPTAGVDPYSRRAIWELLLKYRSDRTVIVSTHYMDEADILGDRIAIISQGKVCCCGSSLFLKARLGTGYNLTVIKSEPQSLAQKNNITDSDSSISDGPGSRKDFHGSDMNGLVALVQYHIPGARLVEDIGREAVINFPHSASEDGTLALFLAELERRQAQFGITGYGLSDTTLEEVFLKAVGDTSANAEMDEVAAQKRASPDQQGEPPEDSIIDAQNKELMNEEGQDSFPLTGWGLIRQQLRALLTKRLLCCVRSRRGFFAEIMLPALFVLVSLLFTLLTKPLGSYYQLELQPWLYNEQETFLSNDAPNDADIQNLVKVLLDPPGFGTKCMDPDRLHKCEQIENGTVFRRPPISYSMWQLFNTSKWTVDGPAVECQCYTDKVRRILPECPEGAGGLPPPQIKTLTGDVLQNLTGYNISNFLVKTYSQILKKGLKAKNILKEFRYGGFSLGGNSSHTLNDGQYLDKSMMDVIRRRYKVENNSSLDHLLDRLPYHLNSRSDQQNVKVWYNNKGWHAVVSFVNVMNNGILRANLPPEADRQKHGLTAYNHPLNLTMEQLMQLGMLETSVDFLVSICVIFAMSLVPASFVLFLIEERVSKSKHLQFLSGVKPVHYWIANFVWDMLNYTVTAILVVFIFLAFQKKAYVSEKNLPALVFLLLFYGWSIIPLMYPASFVFSVPVTAYVTLTCINIFLGLNCTVSTFILDRFADEYLVQVNRLLKVAFLIFPHFCLGQGLIDMAKNQVTMEVLEKFGTKQTLHPLEWDCVGKNLFAMAVEGAVFFVFNLLIEYKFCIHFRPLRKPALPALGLEDEDVARERERVKTGRTQEDILTIIDLTKLHNAGKKPAVDQLCLGLPRGECFGLLGVNGAGKTSTFYMLTGDMSITYGNAVLYNHSVLTEVDKVYQFMGYCPQFDATNNLLTAREHLELYARLRGIPEANVAKVAQWGIRNLNLMEVAHREVGGYSGGNKRKLSAAISLVGSPQIIFLDEPTTGMDPKSKRCLWNCLLRIVQEGRSVILTSHSMEECEALCTRMAIMVNGRFQCLGSVQHLKNRFGSGYTIILRLSTRTDPCLVNAYIQDSFPGIELKERYHNVLQYQLPPHACSLSRVFDILSNNYEEWRIVHYSVSQTTLDQVFVSFAKEQTDDDQLRETTINEEPQQNIRKVQFHTIIHPVQSSLSRGLSSRSTPSSQPSQPRSEGSKIKKANLSGVPDSQQSQDIPMQPMPGSSVDRPDGGRSQSNDPSKLFLVKRENQKSDM